MEKIINYNNLNKLLNQLKTANTVLVGGCFDLLHLGHLKFLQAAKKRGEILLVALEADENVKKLKGNNRPIHSQEERAEVLANLLLVDYVILLPEMKNNTDYQDLILKIKPKIIAITENDHRFDLKRKQASLVGAKVIEVLPYLKEYSTTKIINTNINKYKTNLN